MLEFKYRYLRLLETLTAQTGSVSESATTTRYDLSSTTKHSTRQQYLRAYTTTCTVLALALCLSNQSCSSSSSSTASSRLRGQWHQVADDVCHRMPMPCPPSCSPAQHFMLPTADCPESVYNTQLTRIT